MKLPVRRPVRPKNRGLYSVHWSYGGRWFHRETDTDPDSDKLAPWKNAPIVTISFNRAISLEAFRAMVNDTSQA